VQQQGVALGEPDRAEVGCDYYRVADDPLSARRRTHGRQHLHQNASPGIRRGGMWVHHDQPLRS